MSFWLDLWTSLRRECLLCRCCSKRWRKRRLSKKARVDVPSGQGLQEGATKKTSSYSSDSSTAINDQTQQALIVTSKRVCRLDDSYPMPELQKEGEVMIRNYATGLNPVDWKMVEYGFCLPEFPWIVGREMAGIVERVSLDVTSLRLGDRVWTSRAHSIAFSSYIHTSRPTLIWNKGTYYRDRRAGCFQEFVTVPEHTVIPIPAGLSFESAACLGVGALTAAMTLWKWLGVPMTPPPRNSTVDSHRPECILIWGGSTVTGQFAIQLSVRSGLEVIAVTSEKTATLARDLGATHVVTRNNKSDEIVLDEIHCLAGDRIIRGIDLVGPDTAALGLKALSKTSPSLFAPLAMISSSQSVPENIRIQTVEMKGFVLEESSRKWAMELNRLVESGELRLPQLETLEGGLERIEEGLMRIKRGDMEGKKIVVSMSPLS